MRQDDLERLKQMNEDTFFGYELPKNLVKRFVGIWVVILITAIIVCVFRSLVL